MDTTRKQRETRIRGDQRRFLQAKDPVAAAVRLAAAVRHSRFSSFKAEMIRSLEFLSSKRCEQNGDVQFDFVPVDDPHEVIVELTAVYQAVDNFIRSVDLAWDSLVRKNPGVGRSFQKWLVDPSNDELGDSLPSPIKALVSEWTTRGRVIRCGLNLDRLCFSLVRLINDTLSCFSRITIESDPAQVREALASFRERITSKIPFAPTTVERIVGSWVDHCISLAYSNFPNNLCKHGPGAVAETKLGRRKSAWIDIHCDDLEWYADALYRRVPFSEGYHIPTESCGCIARVLAVPKDFRGPRIIAAEPIAHQYLEMGVDRYVRERVRCGPLGSAIHFNDQSFNRDAAQKASIDGEMATIDLSDASDTVRCTHVRALMPQFWRVCAPLRAKAVVVTIPPSNDQPDGAALPESMLLEHTAWATMGSALCFCSESLVFLIICLATYCEAKGIRPTYATLGRVLKESRILVYGDDIVVPTNIVVRVMDRLSSIGFRPNIAKSCYNSFFRESCGIEAISGFDVTRWRPRHLPGALQYRWSAHLANMQNLVKQGMLYAACDLALQTALEVCFVDQEREAASIASPWCIYAPRLFELGDTLPGFLERTSYQRSVRIWVESRRREPEDFWRRLEDAMREHEPTETDQIPTSPDGYLRIHRVKLSLPGWPRVRVVVFDSRNAADRRMLTLIRDCCSY